MSEPEPRKIISAIATMPLEKSKQQFVALSSISNYHWLGYPCHSSDKEIEAIRLRRSNHIIEEHASYVPTSPRNRILYFIRADKTEADMYRLVKFLLHKEAGDVTDDDIGVELDIEEPPMKRQKRSKVPPPTIVKVNPRLVWEQVSQQKEDDEVAARLNCASKDRHLYTNFKDELQSEGELRWRMEDENLSVCVMNDYSASTGVFLPHSYVHVTCTKFENDMTSLTCTCGIFSLISRAAHQEHSILPGQPEIVPSPATSCMHCRLYNDHLIQAYQKLQQSPERNALLDKVDRSLQFMNDPVQLVGPVLKEATTKFSVKGDETYSIVNLTFTNGICMDMIRTRTHWHM